MDPNEFLAFKDWLSDASQVQHPYLLKVMDQDILPCLNFSADKQVCATGRLAWRWTDRHYRTHTLLGALRYLLLGGGFSPPQTHSLLGASHFR